MLRRPRLLRVVLWIILPPLIAWVAYLLLANLYLNARGLELTIGEATRSAEVKLGSAFTWWPGRVIVKDLQVIVKSSSEEMDLRIDEVDTNIRLTSLFDKEFETRTATITGVSFRLRKTRPLAELCKRRGVPPIADLALPPGEKNAKCEEQAETARQRGPGPPTPPERLFHIRLEGLVIRDVREIWVETYRVTGRIELDGRLRFWPKKELGFAVSNLRGEGVDLDVGRKKRIDRAAVEGWGRMRLIQLQHAEAETTWRAVSLRVKAGAPDVDLALLQQIVSGTNPIAPPRMPRIDGRALLDAELAIDEGAAKLISIDAAAMQAGLRLIKRQLVGRVKAELLLEPISPRALGIKKAKVTMRNIELRNGETRSFGDTDLELQARGASVLSPGERKLKIDLYGSCSDSGLLLELMTAGFQKKIADLLIDEDAPATFTGELVADEDIARFERFSVKADALRVDGRMRLSPDPGGRMVINYRGIEIEKAL